MPRPITAAWLVIPPRSVNTPAAACMPRMSSGLVSRRTKIQGSPRAACACAANASNTILPLAAPGLAATAVAKISRFASASIWRCNNSPNARGSMRINASCWGMIPSSASLTAIRIAAFARRLTRTPSSMNSSPFWIVNSICISSRRRCRISLACSTNFAKISGSLS